MTTAISIEGRLCSGLGEGASFTGLDWVARQFRQKLGYEPHPGTLNLSLAGEAWISAREQMHMAAGIAIEPAGGFCAAKCFAVLIEGCIEGAAILPEVAAYPDDKLEIVAPVAVRQALQLSDGDRVSLCVHIS